MILRKPYAFFIKHFKLFHLILSFLVIYVIVRISGIINFITDYLNSNDMYITKEQFANAYNIFDFVIPVIIIFVSSMLLFIMSLKKKPSKFYWYSLGVSLSIFFLNLYGYYTLKKLTEFWLEVNILNVLSDIYLFAMLANIILCVMSISRGVGFNFGRFDFNSQLSQFELSDEDNAEFEVAIDFDINDVKRNAKKQARYVKYFYKENKKTIFTIIITFIAFGSIFGLFSYFKYKKDIISGNILNYNGFEVTINDSYVINTNAVGQKFDDEKYLLVIDVNLNNVGNNTATNFSIGTSSVTIGSDIYQPSQKYDNDILDLGKIYNNENIKTDKPIRRLFVYEIPINHIFSKALFGIYDISTGTKHYVKLTPENLSNKDNQIVEKFLGEEMSLDDSTLKNIKVDISSYDVETKYKLEYRMCAQSNNCVNSVEYLYPQNSSSNYDKAILKLNGKFDFKDNTIMNDFYTLLNNFGYIEYSIDGNIYRQTDAFRQIIPTKIKDEDSYYIEVNEAVKNSESLCIGFKIRNMEYRYYLTQER